MAAACLLSIPRDRQPPGFFDFLAQKKNQRRPQHGPGGEFADFVPAGRNRRTQNVGGELEFQCERKPSCQFKPDILLVGHRHCVIGRRCGQTPPKQHPHGPAMAFVAATAMIKAAAPSMA
jgi:hypothetical protein